MASLPGNQEDDPIELFSKWMTEATAHELNDPTAAALATSTADGHPSVRMVLIKNFDSNGFSFYTNAKSRKGQELQTNPHAALCFHWKSLRRQVRIEGRVSELSADNADHYFHSRSRGSQIAAAISQQSHALASRETMIREVAEFSKRFEGQEIPRPKEWRGYLLKPTSVEFWTDGPDRLHDRVLFKTVAGDWTTELLYP